MATKRGVDPRIERVGAQVRDARSSMAMTQTALADVTGLDESAIRAIETGRRGVSIETLLKLADALEVLPSMLLGEDPPEGKATRAVTRLVQGLRADDQQLALRLVRQLRDHRADAATRATRRRRETKG